MKTAPTERLRPLGRLWPLLDAHRGLAVCALVFVLLSTGGILAITGAGRFVIDQAGAVRSVWDLALPFAVLAAVAAVFAVSTGLRIYFVTLLGERVAADLRRAIYDHVLTLDPAHLLGVRTGEILSRMTQDATLVENMAGNVLSVSLRNALSLAGAVVLLVVLRPSFAAMLLLIMPFVVAPLFVTRRRLRNLSAVAQDRFAEAVGYAGESIDGLETVQAFGQEPRASARFAAAVETALVASRRRVAVRATISTIMIALIFGGLLIVLAQCAYATYVQRTMTPGVLVQLGMLSVLAASALSGLGEMWGEVQKAAGALQRIGDLLATRPHIASPAAAAPLPEPARGEIAFEDVHFAYPAERAQPALRGFTLRIGAGERVALVGPSGAGKSTVFRLLLRFYEPHAGRVCVDGVDVATADLGAVRGRMALVSQDPSMFSGSVGDNIRFGREDADAHAVARAARAAQLDAFLAARADGLETPVGERAKTLSGGQRQRLALARALVRDAPILLLDEATSALDAENERLVHDALAETAELAGGGRRTTLIIAHRLATVLECDRIVVMDGGRIVEQGTHAELLARNQLYARLAALQFAL